MASRDVILNIIADIGRYQSELAKVPGVTEKQAAKAAKRFAFQFARAEADAAKAAARASASANRRTSHVTTQSLRSIEQTSAASGRAVTRLAQNTAQQIPDVVTQLSMGANPFQVLLQQGGQVVQQMDSGILPALARVGPALGVVGAAAAATGAAYLYFANQLEKAEERMESASDRATSASNAFRGLSAATREIADETAIATGEETKAEQASRKRQEQIRRQADASIRWLEGEIRKRNERLKALDADARVTKEKIKEQNRLNALNERQLEQIDAIKKKTERLTGTVDLLTFAEGENNNETGRGNSVNKEREKRLRALADLQGILADVQMRNATAEEQIILRRDQQLAKIAELEDLTGDHALANQARHDVEMDAIRQEMALFDEQKRQREEEAEAERKRREETIAAVEKERQKRIEAAEAAAAATIAANERALMSIMGSASSIGNSLSDIAFMSAQAQAEAGKKGAEAAFETAKRLSVAAIGVDFIAGTFKALSNSGGRPLVAAANIAALALQKGVAVAQIGAMKPAFDVGGVVRAGVSARTPDQVDVSALPGEGFLTRQGVERVGGERGVREINRGGTMGGQVVALPVYKHFDRFMADELKRGGRLTRAMRRQRNRPTGHRGY